MATTPTLKLTVPAADGSDDIGTWPGITNQLGRDIENALFLATDAHRQTDLPSAYGFGVSLMPISSSGADSGGWSHNAGMIMTMSQSLNGGFTTQFYFSGAGTSGASSVYYRQGNGAAGWLTGWQTVTGLGTPTATASGTYTFDNANTPRSATVAYPVGRFSSAPVVVVSTHDRDVVAATTGGSPSGFTLLLGANGGGDTIPLNGYAINWIAMLNN